MKSSSAIAAALGLAGLFIAGAAAADPGYADGITVYSHRGHRVPDSVSELSRLVTYSDLDLTTRAGQDELNWRIGDTAQQLCDRLGEGDERGRRSSVLPTCQASARDGARSQVRRAIDAQFYARSTYTPQYAVAPPAQVYVSEPQYAPVETTTSTWYVTPNSTYYAPPQYYPSTAVTTYSSTTRSWSSDGYQTYGR